MRSARLSTGTLAFFIGSLTAGCSASAPNQGDGSGATTGAFGNGGESFGAGGSEYGSGGESFGAGGSAFGNGGTQFGGGGTQFGGGNTSGSGGNPFGGGAFGNGGDSFGTGGSAIGNGGSLGAGGGVAGAGGGIVGAGGMDVGNGGSIGAGGAITGSGGSIGAGGVTTSSGGSVSSGGTSTGSGGSGTVTGGTCCSDGNCLCHGPAPTGLTSQPGPFTTASFVMTSGTVYYPTNAQPPFAAVSICPGFLNTGPEMAPWGPFYASYGIVTVVTNTGALDLPATRGMELLNAIKDLKTQNTTSSSPLNGKLAGRYGTSGYSMGGGGTTLASESDPTLLTSVGLAAWGPDGTTIKTPTLFICSDADTVAACTGTDSAYQQMPSGIPKMILDIPNESHFNWFSPTDAGMGESGEYALAFQKVFLEGDTRWKPLLLTKPVTGTTTVANIQ
jgi:hypothetical protein